MFRLSIFNKTYVHTLKNIISDWCASSTSGILPKRTPVVQSFRNVRLSCVKTNFDATTAEKSYASDSSCILNINNHDTRLIKVAVVGMPNAGKSTIINQLVGQQVCSASNKVHTTRFKVRAVVNEENTQVVFLDTPGLVGKREVSVHHLEKSFVVDSHAASQEADTLCVIHDVSNKWTRDRIDERVMELLRMFRHKRSLLVLNKVDLLKSKRLLLDLVRSLTSGKSGNITSWPHFEQIFMVSALTGSGIPELKDFLLDVATPGPWMFKPNICTDQSMERLIEDAVKAALLNNLPQEIPYEIKPALEHLHESQDGKIIAVVLIECSPKRIEKIVMGTKGWRIRKIAQAAEQQLASAFDTSVMLNLVVTEPKQC